MSLEASATLIMDTNGMMKNQARYQAESGQISNSIPWNNVPNPDQEPIEYHKTCPKAGGKATDCTFTWPTSKQPNGYWQDAIYRCTVFTKCIGFRKEMSAIESRLEGVNEITGKRGCTKLTCEEEIREMNVIIQKVGDYLRTRPGVTDPWWTPWASTTWQIERQVRRTADQSELQKPKETTLSGTYLWKFKGKEESSDRAEDAAKTSDRAKARYGELTEFWPKYDNLGYTVIK